MPAGFFSQSTLAKSRAPAYTLPQCGACRLYETCNSPKMPVTGDGNKGILIVAEAPGKEEDKQGVQLVGESGQLLRRELRRLGIDLDRDCWKTNSIICHPEGNVTPTSAQIDYCRPNITNAIRDLNPVCIITLGGPAVQSVLQPYYEDKGGFPAGRWAGWRIPLRPINTWVCPTYHPAYLLRAKDDVPKIYFRDHLQNAVACANGGRPWEYPFDPADRVEIILNTDKAAKKLAWMLGKGGPIAFDFETNMLKPDGPNARIISCAVCWRGRKTIAYPWAGLAVDATRALLLSPQPKVGYHAKFEERWARAVPELGIEINGWVYDGMQGAHVCDNRPAISSLSFQSLVRLGVPVYDKHIKPFLEAQGTRSPNRVASEIDLRDLLKYNSVDAWCEYHVAVSQIAELQYPLSL